MSTPFNITAGLPYSRVIRVEDVIPTIWPTLGDLEVRSQVRVTSSATSRLLLDLAEFMTPTVDGTDLVITLSMTGEDTRELRGGYFDVVVSDTGTTDARALEILDGKFTVTKLTTAAVDV